MPLYTGFRIVSLVLFLILNIPSAVVGIQLLVEFVLVQPLKLALVTTILIMTHKCREEPIQMLKLPESTYSNLHWQEFSSPDVRFCVNQSFCWTKNNHSALQLKCARLR